MTRRVWMLRGLFYAGMLPLSWQTVVDPTPRLYVVIALYIIVAAAVIGTLRWRWEREEAHDGD